MEEGAASHHRKPILVITSKLSSSLQSPTEDHVVTVAWNKAPKRRRSLIMIIIDLGSFRLNGQSTRSL
jgi:hypothetical protein